MMVWYEGGECLQFTVKDDFKDLGTINKSLAKTVHIMHTYVNICTPHTLAHA